MVFATFKTIKDVNIWIKVNTIIHVTLMYYIN